MAWLTVVSVLLLMAVPMSGIVGGGERARAAGTVQFTLDPGNSYSFTTGTAGTVSAQVYNPTVTDYTYAALDVALSATPQFSDPNLAGQVTAHVTVTDTVYGTTYAEDDIALGLNGDGEIAGVGPVFAIPAGTQWNVALTLTFDSDFPGGTYGLDLTLVDTQGSAILVVSLLVV